jgi:hypothetical protein
VQVVAISLISNPIACFFHDFSKIAIKCTIEGRGQILFTPFSFKSTVDRYFCSVIDPWRLVR